MNSFKFNTKHCLLIELYVTPKSKRKYKEQKLIYQHVLDILKQHKYKPLWRNGVDNIDSFVYDGLFFFIVDKKHKRYIAHSSITMVVGFEWKRVSAEEFVERYKLVDNYTNKK